MPTSAQLHLPARATSPRTPDITLPVASLRNRSGTGRRQLLPLAVFEVGFTEIVLILGLALLVLGPEKLPGLAEKVGRWTGRARAMARQLRTQLEQEVTLEQMAKSRAEEAKASETSEESSAAPAENKPPDTTQSRAATAEPELDLDKMMDDVETPGATPLHDAPPQDSGASKAAQ
jgi:sec-independent protein translocase protein TatB